MTRTDGCWLLVAAGGRGGGGGFSPVIAVFGDFNCDNVITLVRGTTLAVETVLHLLVAMPAFFAFLPGEFRTCRGT